jgi:hypothetical protein
MARTADADWKAAVLTVTAAGLIVMTRIHPILILLLCGAIGGLGLL